MKEDEKKEIRSRSLMVMSVVMMTLFLHFNLWDFFSHNPKQRNKR